MASQLLNVVPLLWRFPKLSPFHPTLFPTQQSSGFSHWRRAPQATARILAAKSTHLTVMALLDGSMLRRHKSWLKAEPPTIVVATLASLCQMLEKHIFTLESVRVLVVDEVDFLFNSSKQVGSVRKLLTSFSSCDKRRLFLQVLPFPSINISCMTIYIKNGPRGMFFMSMLAQSCPCLCAFFTHL